MRKIRVAYVSLYDARDVSNWSGLGYYIGRALEAHVGSIEYIGNLKTNKPPFYAFKRMYYEQLEQKEYYWDRTTAAGRGFARQVADQLHGRNFDVVISPGTIPVAYLETGIPVVIWADATFAAMLGYYFFDVCDQSVADGNKMEQAAIDNASLAAYASEWAANSAVKDYHALSSKVRVIPFGANIERAPERVEIQKGLTKPLKLLFVGRDWARKGGDIVLETLVALEAAGIQCELVIVGCTPPNHIARPHVHVYPSLDKRVHIDFKKLQELYMQAHFLLLPARAECYGLVLCEANAFGIPVLGSDTGGIPTIVKNGVNGYLMDPKADGSAYCNKILSVIATPSQYSELSRLSRDRYESQLNWDSAARNLRKALEEVL